jgi:hypothetical protein
MSEEHQQDPPIFKRLSPKTQGLLRASAKQKEETTTANMSTEQTYVDPAFPVGRIQR